MHRVSDVTSVRPTPSRLARTIRQALVVFTVVSTVLCATLPAVAQEQAARANSASPAQAAGASLSALIAELSVEDRLTAARYCLGQAAATVGTQRFRWYLITARLIEAVPAGHPGAKTARALSAELTVRVRRDLAAQTDSGLGWSAAPTLPSGSFALPYPCAENGSCFGDASVLTGAPKTVRVQGYHRRDGTYVRGHYRSRGRR